ncbi:hypothetical protein D3C71_1933460 [compost metagenome]
MLGRGLEPLCKLTRLRQGLHRDRKAQSDSRHRGAAQVEQACNLPGEQRHSCNVPVLASVFVVHRRQAVKIPVGEAILYRWLYQTTSGRPMLEERNGP